MRSFRPLLIFWLTLLTVLAATAGVLHYLGPPRPLQPPAQDPAKLAQGDKVPVKPQPVASSAAPSPASPPIAAPPAPPVAAQELAIPEPDASMQEPAVSLPGRMLPKIADNGRTPAQAFAAAFDPTERHPRIALVIDGIGLDRSQSLAVLRTTPRTMDIALSAYAMPQVLDSLAEEARRQGRECLVSIPMEPSGFPAVEEGDKALQTGANPEQNRQNLEWLLSNIQGCVGATGGSDGMAGERFAESRQAFGDVLSALAHRGLIYLDPRPGAPPPDDPPDDPGSAPALPRVVDVVVDRPTSPDEPASAEAIDRNLATLEKLAAEHGSAIGLAGPPTPVLLERLAVWANGLPARHLVLAPLTAIAPPKPPAQDAPQ